MKILVVSDTHRDFLVLKHIVENNRDADMLIHLGDGEQEFSDVRDLYPDMPMIYVAGNCDYGSHESSHIATVCGLKLFCCHGHLYHVRDGVELLVQTAGKYGCCAALYGHTHVFRNEFIGGMLVMNPGSPSSPRNGNKPTYGVIEISGDGVIDHRIIEIEGSRI